MWHASYWNAFLCKFVFAQFVKLDEDYEKTRMMTQRTVNDSAGHWLAPAYFKQLILCYLSWFYFFLIFGVNPDRGG